MAAMLNTSPSVVPGSWPRAMRSSTVSPTSRHQPAKYFSTRSRGKRSMPAGTGVWVVKMRAGRATAAGLGEGQALLVHRARRMRSRARNAGVALVHVEDLRARARGRSSARTPPMPSTISWRMRSSTSPP